jgi:hypothetical protein
MMFFELSVSAFGFGDLQRKEEIFSDLPGSSGRLGPCLPTLAESSNATVPMTVGRMDGEPRGGAPVYTPPFVIVRTPGFSLDFASSSSGIMPFTNEHLFYDPDRVGLERLNLLSRVSFGKEGPTFMDRERF